MPVTVVLGLQWGDEGKGKIVDKLAKQSDVVIRFQGGNNAGHTLYILNKSGKLEKVVLHLIPSGIFHPHTTNVIGPGVVLDPHVFMDEYHTIRALGVNCEDRLFISSRTILIMPYHKELDRLLNGHIGTTGRGIGPAYEDFFARCAITAGDCLPHNKRRLMEKISSALKIKNLITGGLNGKTFTVEEVMDQMGAAFSFLMPFIQPDFAEFIQHHLDHNSKILAEGAQGTLLDVGHGNYPFVTSSFTTTGGLSVYTGIPPQKIDRVVGVFKAYCTRVGAGPFPTELLDATGQRLRELGHEVGSTTGRDRRCGWLDLPPLRYACQINGVTDLVMTKADILGQLPEFCVNNYYCDQVVSNYRYDPERSDQEPSNDMGFRGFNSISDTAFQTFIERVGNELPLPISIVSFGPNRDDLFFV